jgi:hypothetical protein
MISIWKSYLIEQAASWNLPKDDQWRFLFHNNYQPQQSYITLLWFHRGDIEPRVVTKICRAPDVLKREFENMQQVYPEIPNLMPRPLHFGKHGDFWTLWMDGVPGLRLNPESQDSAMILRSVAETVLKIHLAMRKPASGYGAERHRRMVLDPLETLSGFGSAPAVINGCQCIARQASPGWVNALPAIPQHGDFVFGNLISDKNGVYVIDWEAYGRIDLPLCDLFTFFTSPLLTTGSTPEIWSDDAKRQIPKLVESYATAIGLSASDLPLLFPLTLANWFRSQLDDGHRSFAEKLYKIVNLYFENRPLWEDALLPPSDLPHSVDLNPSRSSISLR